jgi:hypothetical protein
MPMARDYSVLRTGWPAVFTSTMDLGFSQPSGDAAIHPPTPLRRRLLLMNVPGLEPGAFSQEWVAAWWWRRALRSILPVGLVGRWVTNSMVWGDQASVSSAVTRVVSSWGVTVALGVGIT